MARHNGMTPPKNTPRTQQSKTVRAINQTAKVVNKGK